MPHILNYRRDTFDQDNTFSVAFNSRKGERTLTAYLFNSEDEGKIYIMQKNACIKASYTPADYAETARLAAQTPVRDGDMVDVEGVQYKARILGDYSDAGYLIQV